MLLLAVLSLLPSALAQTYTSCNPLNKTICPDDLALGSTNYTIDFTTTTPSSSIWNTTAGTVNYTENGAEFTINKRGDSPTIQSNFYIFFGTVEVHVKAATGQGVVSSVVLESNDLDEVDLEWLGGNTTSVETNYFGKGDTSTFDRAIYYDVDGPMADYHNYTVDWNAERIEWIIDGTTVRTLEYSDAENGTRFPQTPMDVRIGIWAGGDPSEPEGTIEWAGGEINYTAAPFTMYVQSIRVSDASNATAYKYGDTSGTWQSIEMLDYNVNTTTKPIDLDAVGTGSSTSATTSSDADSIGNTTSSATNATSSSSSNSTSTAESAIKKWDGLSKNAKIAVGSSAIGVAAVGVAVLSFCCVKQRAVGRKEREAADREYEKQTAELLAWRNQMGQQRAQTLRSLREAGDASPGAAAVGAGGSGGLGGRMKRMSQSLGFGGNANGGGGYRGEYQRF